MTGNYTD